MRTVHTLLLLLLVNVPVVAQGPLLVTFQGLLSDPSGTPIADGSITVDFALYEQAAGGSEVWSETQTVEIKSGVLSVYLGSETALSKSLFDNQLWLGIAVDSDPEMVPRTLFAVAPYAVALYDTTQLAQLGVACAENGECLSGSCVDGLCCENACEGDCKTCDGSSPGLCESLPLGWPDTLCAPYLCAESGSCATACVSATDCWNELTYYCDSGLCLLKKAAGEPCTFDGECQSGICQASHQCS